VAVRGLDKERILEQFRHRVQSGWDAEFDCALSQVHRIARLRIDQIIVATEDH
jgi:2-oxo-4-hydroxy-4-carboxy--5-ureidoimidazoline (OHCU) decarboxylase